MPFSSRIRTQSVNASEASLKTSSCKTKEEEMGVSEKLRFMCGWYRASCSMRWARWGAMCETSESGQRKTRDESWGEGVVVKGSRRMLRLWRAGWESGMYAVKKKGAGGALLGTAASWGLKDRKT